ncbi:MAG: hypothetical protein N2376_00275 [Clostridia bacterium]|nr:hypothetical protein [Clostridia bacterium]
MLRDDAYWVDFMQATSGFARKYAIMEELDGGFGAGSTPEAFVRLDSWEGRIQASLHIKGLKQGPFAYKLYLIFVRGERLVPILAGTLASHYNGMQNGLEIDAETLKNNGIKPDAVRYAAIMAESQDKKWVPLFASFDKPYKWDESIRQLLLKGPPQEEFTRVQEPSRDQEPVRVQEPLNRGAPAKREEPVKQEEPKPRSVTQENSKAQPIPITQADDKTFAQANQQGRPLYQQEQKTPEPVPVAQPIPEYNNQRNSMPDNRGSGSRCDIDKLEGLLQNNFEVCTPFKRSNRGYSWYRVSDLAKLSNIMYMSGVNVPVFANPKILVGLFKFKHILAGLYRGDNNAHYYVIGVPAKDEHDNRPFENACRWVPITDSPVRDMGGYWLVYVSLKSGEIVV